MKSLLIRVLLGVVLTPTVLVVAFTNSSYEIPYDDYSVKNQEVIISDEMNRILLNPNAENILTTSQRAFNNLIFNNIRDTENPFYNPSPDCDSPLCDYMIIIDQPIDNNESKTGIRGIWATFEEDEVTLYIAARSTYLVSLDTVIEMRFSVTDTNETLTLEFQGARLGRTPIPRALLNTIIRSAMDAVGEPTTAQFGSALEVDAPNLRFELDKAEVAQSVFAPPQIQTLFLDPNTPYSIWMFILWTALDL